jgi:hypothetical protein
MTRKCLPLVAVLVGLLLLGLAAIAAAQSQPQLIDDSQLHALSDHNRRSRRFGPPFRCPRPDPALFISMTHNLR